MIIPNLAIHMNRQVNDGYKFNAQVDMLPLFCEKGEESDAFMGLIASEAGVEAKDILDTDLFLYNRMPAVSLGLNGEFIASGRLDDLQCAFASMKGFLESTTFLKDTLHRINSAMGRTEEEYLMSIASSFLVSADNAHAVHPNHADKTDPTNRAYLNKGIVIKYSANQKYTTDAVSGAIMRVICEKAGVPCQTFTNRSDMLGGSTLGNISQSQVAVLFSSSVEGTGNGNYKLRF